MNEEDNLNKIMDHILENCFNNPNLSDKVEEFQRKYGRLSEEDLRKTFTI
jgi:hypothetical protein